MAEHLSLPQCSKSSALKDPERNDRAVDIGDSLRFTACVLPRFPAPQSMHAASPVSALNLPATYPTHGPPLGPVNPALQAQSEDESLPSGAFELAVQLEQVLSEDFPDD